ncbi:MAG TPA: LLM class flavin-dependent oxidoreductase [Candidatus Sulfotelmatobacter sp.]|nr:LLM class flavin-dependent oxidoreductase [Candidatus Sulfotelmatobacter sp.]
MKFGMGLWTAGATWAAVAEAAGAIDRLGYDHLWVWDHHLPPFGDPTQPILEGWTSISACAALTRHVTVGLLVGENTWHPPAFHAKQALTLDHVSGGRAILGLGSAWWEPEHTAFGIEFGSGIGQRLDWMDEAASIIRPLLAGDEVTHDGSRYRVDHLTLRPGPVRGRVPLLIGGGGEKKTLRSVARYADMWNAFGSLEELRHKLDVLREHCAAVGRDPAEISPSVECKILIRDDEAQARAAWGAILAAGGIPYEEGVDTWLGGPRQIADRILTFADLGFQAIMTWMPHPYDQETFERLVGEVSPLVHA